MIFTNSIISNEKWFQLDHSRATWLTEGKSITNKKAAWFLLYHIGDNLAKKECLDNPTIQ